MNSRKIISSLVFLIFVSLSAYTLDVYIYPRAYVDYLHMLADYEESLSDYDVELFESKDFQDAINGGSLIDSNSFGIYELKSDEDFRKIQLQNELERNRNEYNKYLNLKNNQIDYEENYYERYFAVAGKNIYEALLSNKYEGINFKLYEKTTVDNFPCIELNFESRYNNTTVFEYTVYYSKSNIKKYETSVYRDTSDDRRIEDLPYFTEVCVKAVESVLSFVSGTADENKAKKSTPFYIDTLELSNYFSKETQSVESSVGITCAVNADNSFVVKSDDVVRLYDVNGNIVYDFSKQLSDSGVKNMREVFVTSIDSKINIISMEKISKSYIYDKSKYEKSTNLFLPNSAGIFLIQNGDASGYPVLWNYMDNSIVLAGKDSSSAKVFNFTKFYNFAQSKVTSDGMLAIIGSCTLGFYDETGNVRKIITMKNSEADYSVKQLLWTEKNSFIIQENLDNTLCVSEYDMNGNLAWSLPLEGVLSGFTFSSYKNGILYFNNIGSTSKKIVRFGTSEYSGPEYLKKVGKVNSKISENPEDAKLYRELSDLYLANGGECLAYNALSKYLEKSPADAKSNEVKLRLELLLQRETIKEEVRNVIDLYDEYGEMSATQSFYEVATKIEKLLKQFPNEEDIKNNYNELLDVFGKTSSAVQNNTSDLIVEEIDLAVLFPVLKNVYATNSCGTIKLKNNSGSKLTNISVTSSIRKYVDYASTSESVAVLENGKSCFIELNIPLNDNALAIQENTNVQVQYTIFWENNGRKKKMNVTRPVTIYKKSAMCWNDASMLSCFILPNDSDVSDFSAKALASKNQNIILNRNINIAATLTDAMGAIPLNYVSDPDVSFSSIIDNDYAVDTVHFPGETLSLKSGDCDDMTTLFCSVLESVGISTAIITVPGHIMAAFDAGESTNIIWQQLNRNSHLKVVEHNGKIYIPVETTVMSKGFMECWKSASKRISQKDVMEEFIVIGEQREYYPPVAVESSGTSINVNTKKIADQKLLDMNEAKIIFAENLESAAAITQKGSELNSIAKMYHSLGDDDKAIEILSKSIEVDKTYSPSYKNLANLYSSRGNKSMSDKIAKSMPKEKSAVKKIEAHTVVRASDSGEDDWAE